MCHPRRSIIRSPARDNKHFEEFEAHVAAGFVGLLREDRTHLPMIAARLGENLGSAQIDHQVPHRSSGVISYAVQWSETIRQSRSTRPAAAGQQAGWQ
jgi:hypothetical protein